jgi:hypothetical protein
VKLTDGAPDKTALLFLLTICNLPPNLCKTPDVPESSLLAAPLLQHAAAAAAVCRCRLVLLTIIGADVLGDELAQLVHLCACHVCHLLATLVQVEGGSNLRSKHARTNTPAAAGMSEAAE